MIKRTLLSLLVAVAAMTAMIGVEIVLALRREYLPTTPVLGVGGFFGQNSGTPIKFVVMGDSTSAGVGVNDPDLAYPSLLAERIAEPDRRVELVSLGIAGARVGDVREEQLPDAVKEQPDVVFVGIGANDVTHATPLDRVKEDMSAILDGLRDTGAVVVVAGAPDMRAAAFYEPLRSIAGWRGRTVTEAIEEVAKSHGVPAVPLAAETGPLFARDPDRAYSDDLFHPGAAGYEAWADAIFPVLRDALGRS